jgi:hypothetical protein
MNGKKLKEVQIKSLNLFFCSPYEIRTRITTVKGWCPNP